MSSPPNASDPRVLIIATMRDEGAYILEWLAYHRLVGATDFLIYTNDCSDQTETICRRLAALGLITWRDNPVGPRGRPQWKALNRAVEEPLFRDADWVLHIDVDEFVNIHAGAGRFADLIAAVPEATLISLTWRMFASGGTVAYEPGLVTEQFTRAAPRYVMHPWQATGFKTLFRNLGHFDSLGPHRPRGLIADPAEAVWVNGDGARMPETFLDFAWRMDPIHAGSGLAQLNHYAVKSAECFLVKRARGRPNNIEHEQGLDYWRLRNLDYEDDTSILRWLPALRAAVAELLEDTRLANLHRSAERWRRKTAKALRADPANAALFAQMLAWDGGRLYGLRRHRGRSFVNYYFPEIPDIMAEI